jgi:thiol-disulfide isomerase/thioredoxin
MKKTILISVLAALCLNFSANSQTNRNIFKPLNIGDTIPRSAWSMPLQVLNNQGENRTISLNDYRGKLIMLDFWATWCGSCIANMPKTDSLQSKFQHDFSVVMLTAQDNKTVQAFLKRTAYKPNGTIVTNEKGFSELFPHQIIPHYVWIDSKGVYLGATDISEVNSGRIKSLLAGSGTLHNLKKDMNREIPLYSSSELPLDRTLHYSILVGGWNPGLPSGVKDIYDKETVIGKAMTNSTCYQIFYRIALGLLDATGDPVHPSSIVFNTKNKGFYKKEYYNYEFRATTGSSSELYQKMLNDVNACFPYQVSFERSNKPYLALVQRNDGKGKLIKNPDPAGIKLKKAVAVLNNLMQDMPVIDETGLKEDINVDLTGNPLNPEKALEALKASGLDLIIKHKEMYRFVLSDKPNTQL